MKARRLQGLMAVAAGSGRTDRKPEWGEGHAQWEGYVASRDAAGSNPWPTEKATGQGSELLPRPSFL